MRDRVLQLHTQLPADPNALVFPSREGGFLPLAEFRWAFDTPATTSGVEGLVSHTA